MLLASTLQGPLIGNIVPSYYKKAGRWICSWVVVPTDVSLLVCHQIVARIFFPSNRLASGVAVLMAYFYLYGDMTLNFIQRTEFFLTLSPILSERYFSS